MVQRVRDRVFICYRREDTRFAAGRLADDLEDVFGTERVYRDVVSIEAARPWAEQIQRAIARSAVVLVVIGSEWVTASKDGRRRLDDPDDTLSTEVATALRQDVPIIPVLIEDTRMPQPSELPDELKPLAGIQGRRLADADWSYHFQRLVEDLERTGMSPRRARWRPTWSGRRALGIGAIALVVAASDDSRTQAIEVGSGPDGIAVAAGTVWVVTAREHAVVRVNAARERVVGEPIQVGSDPDSVAIGAGAVWVTNTGSGTVTRIDP